MKYSQYIEVEKLLEKNNLTIADVKENPDVLNEVGVGLIGAIFAGGLGLLFRKKLLSWGVKSYYVERLKTYGKKFERLVLKNVSKKAKANAEYRQSLIKKEIKLEPMGGPEAEAEKRAVQNLKQNYERRISKDIDGYIDNIMYNKNKEIKLKIEAIKSLSESHKIALKIFWDTIFYDIKQRAHKQMADDGIITDPVILNAIMQEAQDGKDEALYKLSHLKKVLAKEKEQEKQGSEEKKVSRVEKIRNNIEELAAEKSGMKEADVIRKTRAIIRDIKTVDEKDKYDLFDQLENKVGREVIRGARKPEDTSTLEPDDEL